jgi:subtilase family serine protease
MSRRSRLASRPSLERLDGRLVLSAVTPAQIQAAYGLNAVTSGGTTLTGAGQTIAIIDAYNDPNAATELAAFDARYGLPAASLTVDNLGSASNTNAGWEEEEALDIEAAHLAAPGAKILLIEARSASIADLMAAVNVANNTKGVTVVSMSWGGSDTSGETRYDSYFTHTGITYLASSGDSGAGAEWPSDSPNVIAVGGTSLAATSSGRVLEVAWSGSGGGTSRVESEPSYQATAQSTGRRTTPDVSAVADPNTGLVIASIAGGGWVQVGGTSLSTPIWAGLIAEADQGRALAGKATLSSTQALTDLYNAPSGSFYDVTSGPRASASYDTSTGLGTPNGKTLVAALVADPSTTASTAGNGVGGDVLPATSSAGSSTSTTGSTTTTTGSGTTPPPRYPWQPPFGGRGFFGGFGGYSTPSGGWAGASVPRNSGQPSGSSYTPITPIRRNLAPVVTTTSLSSLPVGLTSILQRLKGVVTMS